MKRILLALVLLSPWLLAVWVGLHNLRQPRQLRLVTWTTPALSIGGWLLLSSSLGAALGTTTVFVLLQTERSSRRRPWSQASLEENFHGNEGGDEGDAGLAGEEPHPGPGHWQDTEATMGEPPPIVDVPFRVVRAARSPDPAPDASPFPPYNAPASNGDDWEPPQSEAW